MLALAFAAGYVDALSYLGLDRVFTANMTGNTVLLGIALAQFNGDGAARSSFALAVFWPALLWVPGLSSAITPIA